MNLYCGHTCNESYSFSSQPTAQMLGAFPASESNQIKIDKADISIGFVSSSQFGSTVYHYDPKAEILVIGDIRLENRRWLLNYLKIGPAANNAKLIAHSYLKWRENAPVHLEGGFAFALWSKQDGCLILCRDHMGAKPLFYTKHNGGYAFANRIKSLRAITPHQKTNYQKIAHLIDVQLIKAYDDLTFFDGIYSLPAATTLKITRSSSHQNRYWRPSRFHKLSYRKDEEILEKLQEISKDAVAGCLIDNRKISAQLSGGLDSSAIVSLAAPLLATQGKTLPVLSSVLQKNNSDSRIRDEREYIEQFRSWANVDIKYVTHSNGLGPFSTIQELVELGQSPFLFSKHYVNTELAQESIENGAHIILTGVGGEAGITSHGKGVYADLFIHGRWPTLWRELKAASKKNNVPEWLIFRSQVLRTLFPAALVNQFTPKSAAYKRERENTYFLQSHFIEKVLGKSYLSAKNKPIKANQHHFLHRIPQALSIENMQMPSTPPEFIGADQVEFRYPFLNKNLLEFCLAAPAHLKIKDGYRRYLVRGALDGILPPKIQWRTTKEPFSPAYYHHYNAQRQIAVDMFNTVKKNDPVREIVDIEKLKQWSSYDMTDTRDADYKNYVAAYYVPLGAYLITFLRQFDDFRI